VEVHIGWPWKELLLVWAHKCDVRGGSKKAWFRMVKTKCKSFFLREGVSLHSFMEAAIVNPQQTKEGPPPLSKEKWLTCGFDHPFSDLPPPPTLHCTCETKPVTDLYSSTYTTLHVAPCLTLPWPVLTASWSCIGCCWCFFSLQ
jgi:hypothetical protein